MRTALRLAALFLAAGLTVAAGPAQAIPTLNQGHCKMTNARYVPYLHGWYFVCG